MMSLKVLFYVYPIFVVSLITKVNSSLNETHPLYGITSLASGNGTCSRDLEALKEAVDRREVWALKNVSGRPPEGFLYGNNLWIGSHAECMEIPNRKPYEIRIEKGDNKPTPHDYPPYDLAFAMVFMTHNSTMQIHMRLPLDHTIQLGFCLPKSCSKDEIFSLVDQYVGNGSLEFQQFYNINLAVQKVKILEEDIWWMLKLPKVIVFLVIVLITITLTICGTVYDVKRHNQKKRFNIEYNKQLTQLNKSENDITNIIRPPPIPKPNGFFDFLKCFSIYGNVKKWSKGTAGNDTLPIIQGLKFFSMAWVIVVHSAFYQNNFSINPPIVWRFSEHFLGQIFGNSTYCVDTFLFLSAFLMAFNFYKMIGSIDSGQPINCFNMFQKYILMFFHRLLRLTPTYAATLLLVNVVHTYFSKTSSLYFQESPENKCDKYWWRNLLYINNLFPRSEMCLSWSWYLSLDMQFFLYGLFLLFLSTLYFKVVVALLIISLFIQFIVTGYTSYNIGYIPTMDDQLERLDLIYDFPWNRIGPYIAGMVTAYILVVRLNQKLHLKERTRLILWTIFPLINLWIVFTLYTREVSVEFSAIYMGISRTLWGVGIGWFVIAVSTGNAQLLFKFLSFPAFIPLGRLTFCAYLLNPFVVTMIALGAESELKMSISQIALDCIGTIFLTMLLAFIMTLLFESPFIALSKLLIKKRISSQGIVESDLNKSNGTIATQA